MIDDDETLGTVQSEETKEAEAKAPVSFNHREILIEAARILGERGVGYDQGSENSFPRAAKIASLKLDREVTPYEVAVILESVKDARRATDPGKTDTHIDGIAYRAFAAEYVGDYIEKTRPK